MMQSYLDNDIFLIFVKGPTGKVNFHNFSYKHKVTKILIQIGMCSTERFHFIEQ